MTGIIRKLVPGGGTGKPSRSAGLRLEVAPLEGRVLATVTGLTAQASPTILWHPSAREQPKQVQNQTIVPVTIAGQLNDTAGPAPAIAFHVIDEYGVDQPSGFVVPQALGGGLFLYSTRVGLQLSRHANDLNGRQYTIVVTASDGASSQTASAVVTVPHMRFNFGPSALRIRRR
jgi:hypothetical protein